MGLFKNEVGRPSNETIKKRNIFKGVCFVLVLIIIGLVVLLLNEKGIIEINKKQNNNDDNKIATNNKKEDKWYEPTGTAKTLSIYGYKYDEKGISISESEKVVSESGLKYELLGAYKCDNENCMLATSHTDDEKTIVIKDNGYVVYNYKSNRARKIDFSDSKVKIEYINNANSFCENAGDICFSTKLAGDEVYYILEEYTYADGPQYFFALINSNLEVITLVSDDTYKIKNNNAESNKKLPNDLTLYDDGSVVYFEDTYYYKYNSKDKLVKSDEYKSTVVIAKKYIVVVDKDDYLKVLDLNGKEKAKFVKIDDTMEIHWMLSGWYEQNKKAGIYVVVEDKSVKYSDLSEELQKQSGGDYYPYGYEYYYIPDTNETGKIPTYIGGYAKPVLYLYPKDDNTKISVSFNNPSLLTTTYPKFKNSWEVIANKNGDLYDENGKYYYGLYWEESGSIKVDFKEGFYVTKENAIEFLEDKLTYIGLNDRERNEFIMYWLPILEKNKKNLVYFELTESRENYNKLNISPKPDSLLRLAIHIKKVDKKIDIKKQKLTSFKRKGFTAVEWGGVIH